MTPQLPTDLWLQIAGYLQPSDICNLRRTCTQLARVGATALQEKLHILYVHPLSDALQRAVDICGDSFFANKIDTIVILGRPMLRKDDSDLNPDNTLSKNLNSHPWPHMLTASGAPASQPPGFREIFRTSTLSFQEAYRPLLEALAKLPSLQAIGYAPTAQEAGYNKVSDNDINTHANTYFDLASVFGGPGQPTLSQAKWIIRWSDVEVLTGILVSQGLRGDLTADLGTSDIPRQRLARRHLLLPAQPSAHVLSRMCYALASRNLVSLKLTLSAEWDEINILAAIIEGAARLDSLTLRLPTGYDRRPRPRRAAKPVDYVRRLAQSAPLRTFELEAVDDYAVHVCQSEFQETLEPLRGRLQTFKVRNINVAPNTWPTISWSPLCDVLVWIHENMQLEHAEWRIKAGTRMGKTPSVPLGQNVYTNQEECWPINEVELAQIAVEFGAHEMGDGEQDFGPCIVRRRRGQE